MSPRVLLVDDDYTLLRGLRASLCNAGYEALTANNGLEGLHAARRHQPDLVVLDVNMPWMSGLELCERLRDDEILHNVPILMLSDRSSPEAKISGLDQGADDYLCKPFNTGELHARLRALLRRKAQPAQQSKPLQRVQAGPLALDLGAGTVRVDNGEARQLTPAEQALLHFLMERPNKLFSSKQLLVDVWDYDPLTTDGSLVRWHVRNLRAKIESDPAKPQLLRTVPRHGYILQIEGRMH